MANNMLPVVDVAVLSRSEGPLCSQVQRAIDHQQGVRTILHRVHGLAQSHDQSRYETIARARNEGRTRGQAPWLMFVDDDVELDSHCIATLLAELQHRPALAALGADYLNERRPIGVASHVAMGATMFRRPAFARFEFRWKLDRCECQCCCDDLRRRHLGIDYSRTAKARHLVVDPTRESHATTIATTIAECRQQRSIPPLTPASPRPSICLVVCYFGPLPEWIGHYLKSCSRNPSIDFLLVTDSADLEFVPTNVHIHRLDRDAFETLASHQLGFNVLLTDARKLCDFKPAYGEIFADLLAPYDYWGYTDLDIVYGDLRHFLDELEQFDVWTARAEYLVGHFTLFRNTPAMRHLYRESTDFRAALRASDVQSFDECGGQWWPRLCGRRPVDDATCDSMTHVVERQSATQRLTARFAPRAVESPELPNQGWRLRWDEGRLSHVGKRGDVMYVHFHEFKRRGKFRSPAWTEAPNAFDISPAGFSS